jgi:hypothetical protein
MTKMPPFIPDYRRDFEKIYSKKKFFTFKVMPFRFVKYGNICRHALRMITVSHSADSRVFFFAPAAGIYFDGDVQIFPNHLQAVNQRLVRQIKTATARAGSFFN